MNAKQFAKVVLAWFEHYGRHNLPWQKNVTPYRVWISEVMLQQTRVSTVIPYFHQFIKQFPTIKNLALSSLDDILAHWSGLGYYARAYNLHNTAQIIHQNYYDQFPSRIETLVTLPGIGRSTAGAILSLGMHRYAVILDGNIKRILSRYKALNLPINQQMGINALWTLAGKYTPKNCCWDYNQAMMDIGSMICTRTKPKCLLCPVKQSCKAFRLSHQMVFPMKKKIGYTRKAVYLLLVKNATGEVLLEKRPLSGIWSGLWSFPECSIEEDIETWCQKKFGFEVMINERWNSIFYRFGHCKFEIRPILLQITVRQAPILEYTSKIWYKAYSKLPGGISAPIAHLLKQLLML